MLHLAFPNLVAAEGEKRVHLFASETDAEHASPIGHRQDDLCRSVVGSDLDAHGRGDEHSPFERVANGFGARVVVPIGHVMPEEAFLVHERTVVFDLVTARPLRRAFGDREQPLIRTVCQASRMLQATIHKRLLAVLDEPHAAIVIITGDVEAATRHGQNGMTSQTFGDNGGRCFRGTPTAIGGAKVEDHPGAAGDCDKMAIGANGQSAGLPGIGSEDGYFAIKPDTLNLIVVDEKHLAFAIASRRARGLKVAGGQLPVLMRDKDLLPRRRWGLPARARPAAPEVRHGLLVVFHITGYVSAVDDAELVVVTRELEGFVHFLIEQEPVAGGVLHVAHAGGEKRSDRLGLELRTMVGNS